MHFAHEHYQQIECIAMVTDSQLVGMAKQLGKLFTSAEIRHFPFSDDAKALEWLRAG